MSSEPLSPAFTNIVDDLASLINEGNVQKAVVEGGWRYHGEAFQKEIDKLEEMMVRCGNKVIRCHATHFTRGANIQNPTKRLVIFQIRGTSKLVDPGSYQYLESSQTPKPAPGELLQSSSYQYLEESRTLIAEGEGGVDVGIVVLARDTSFKKM
ncbi:uncharacterized protein LDX57_007867 [Aspergillus melleus]|uniref:uncharacterized protein n=1 Tax=Aspergillus melleus TaxID=138277 RepID=UPI001E8D1D86|nr:uncharacterized protein LDX57_007867 [Aspergillus melleus]KAH8430198.1 hypothetical protein LDX57_007867 [Aspergillus melleus]